jgi:hypothetical protein
MGRGLGEGDLRLGPALEIFLFFVRHLAADSKVVTDGYQNGPSQAGVPENHADPGS